MKYTSILSFFAMMAVASSRVVSIEVDSANATLPSPLANCIITSWTAGDCSSGAMIAYDYVVDGCRSCESFANAHAFSLGDGCPSGTFYANSGVCGNVGDQFAIPFSGPGCYGVNTGENWQSGNPCFN